jgi:hypothetical protein
MHGLVIACLAVALIIAAVTLAEIVIVPPLAWLARRADRFVIPAIFVVGLAITGGMLYFAPP